MPPKNRNTPEFAQRLAQLRKARGLTQAEVADAVGVSQSLISMYEHGVNEPAASILVQLARTLGVSCDDLVGFKKTKGPIPPKVSRRVLRRLEQIERLPARHQRIILNTIDTFLKGARATSVSSAHPR